MPPFKIVITGPESVGKSTIASHLSTHFNGTLIKEFARDYILQLRRPYTYDDVEVIAKRQIHDLKTVNQSSENIVFFDTFLIITKVWFEVVYKTYPQWIDNELQASGVDLFLLCAPDLPWIQDEVRENGGEMREWLFNEYEKNLIRYKFNYRIVNGFDSVRLDNAINHVKMYLASQG